MTIRLWIYGLIVSVLLVAGIATWAHRDGYDKGQVTQKIATDKESLTVAHTATQEASVNQEKFNKRVDEAHDRTEKARLALVPIREKVAITPNGVSVNGDSTPSVVIPALVNIIHYQDTLQIRSDSELKAQQFRYVADTVTAGAARREAAIATELAHDVGQQKSPRCGSKCGILIGSLGTLAVVAAFIHFAR